MTTLFGLFTFFVGIYFYYSLAVTLRMAIDYGGNQVLGFHAKSEISLLANMAFIKRLLMVDRSSPESSQFVKTAKSQLIKAWLLSLVGLAIVFTGSAANVH
ncbi:hypothetical protein [Endozoicomonas sp. ALD040]|uniref:hypothetical protein n=1 Tax=Endozoicomonas sp. ALD040 TaxID=3403079 RepID=UPI003BAE41D3